jgi:phage/conjugal plasmid C-4 type zinc finger TraR family protein
MADEADQAAIQQAFYLSEAMSARPVYSGESATECEACGQTIPEGRRIAVPGCRLCVPCQEEQERS